MLIHGGPPYRRWHNKYPNRVRLRVRIRLQIGCKIGCESDAYFGCKITFFRKCKSILA